VIPSDTTQGCFHPNNIHRKRKKFKEHFLFPIQAMFNWLGMEMDEV
jgi:hypothetical protein